MSDQNESGAATVAPEQTSQEGGILSEVQPKPIIQDGDTQPQQGTAQDRARKAFLDRLSGGKDKAPAEPEETAPEAPESTDTPAAPSEETAGAEDAPLPDGWSYTETGRIKKPDGTFGSKEEAASLVAAADDTAADEVAEEDTAADDTAVDDSHAEVGTPEQGNDSLPEGMVRIRLPEGHPLRDQGREFVTAPKDEERQIRALVNGYTRTREAEEARTENERLMEENILLRAQLEASDSLRDKLLTDPEIRAEYDEIYAINPAAAETWLRGIEAKQQPDVQKSVQEKIKEARRKRAETESQREARQFRQHMRAYVDSDYPMLADLPHLDALMEEAFQSYSGALSFRARQGYDVDLDPNEFVRKHLAPVFYNDRQAGHRLRQAAAQRNGKTKEQERRLAEAKAKADGKKREQEHLEDAANRHGDKNPLAQVPSEVRTGAQSTSAEETPDFTGMTADQIKKHQKKRFGLR